MRIFFLIFLSVCFAVDAILHLIACFRRMRVLRSVTKVLLMPLLAGVYLLYAPSPHVFVVIALICGALGDLFLLLRKSIAMLLGMCAFALGHVFYIGAMLTTKPGFHLAALLCILIAAGWMLFVVKRLLPTAPKSLRKPGFFYALLLSGTCLFALYLLLVTQTMWYVISFAGGCLFMISDTILTGQKYRKETKHGNFYVMLTYILAQLFLVAGFALNGGI